MTEKQKHFSKKNRTMNEYIFLHSIKHEGKLYESGTVCPATVEKDLKHKGVLNQYCRKLINTKNEEKKEE